LRKTKIGKNSQVQYECIMDSNMKTGSDVTAIVVAPSVDVESKQLSPFLTSSTITTLKKK